MPFTFAHPAIILPLHSISKKWFSLTGLIIGSMTPDFEYFLRMKPKSEFSHTIGGIFYFDLPIGLITAFIFHNIVRNALIQNLPKFLNRRFSNTIHFKWNSYFSKNWYVVVVSLIIGAASHIFWDGFTHETGFFVNSYAILENSIKIQNVEIPVYKILQHGSTLLGGTIILFSILKLEQKDLIINSNIKKYWLTLFMTIFIVMAIRILLGLDLKLYGQVVVSMISGFFIGLIITPLFLSSNVR